jgi:hypothetical protein
MSASVEEQLHAFATTLLERRGALVEWPAAGQAGTAVLPPEVSAAVGAEDEVVSLACEAAGGGLAVNLAGDFLEWAGRLLDAVPRVGAFRVRDLYLKRKDLEEGIGRAFTWPNAKVRLREGRETTVEYHTWWFHAALTSEDRWETCFCVSLNAASGGEVEIPDPLGLWELQPRPGACAEAPSSYARAAEVARRRLLRSAAAFLARMDVRLERDRKRLHDYYRALLRETDKKKSRGHHAPPDPEKVEATKRAVDLELRRKLAELDERYAMQAAVRPVVLIRTEVPALAVDLSVFRKQAQRTHTVYWNPLLKQFEPLVCSGCGAGAFTVVFTNEAVEPLCPQCSDRAGK